MNFVGILVVLYLLLMAAVSRSPAQVAASEQDFFEAAGTASWPRLAASLAATLLTLPLLLGVFTGSGQHGLSFAAVLWLAFVPGAIAAAIVLAPVLERARIRTLPEYLARRYTQGVGLFAALAFVAFAIFLMAAGLWLADDLSHTLLGWPRFSGALALAAVTLWYVHHGGLTAVLAVNRYLLAIMLIGLGLVLTNQIQHAGGWSELATSWQTQPAEFRALFLPAAHPDWPWPGVLLGVALVLGPWQWFGNQAVVQHLKGTASRWQIQAGLVGAALLLLLATVLLAGLALVSQLTLDVEADPMTALAGQLSPWGLTVLLLALFAALQSSMGSLLLATARVITNDLALSRTSPTGAAALGWGRLWALIVAVLALAAVPVLQDPTGWTHGFLLLTGSFQGPLLALVLAGLLSRAATPAAGMLTLLAGLVVAGMLTLIGMPGLYVAGVSFMFSVIMIIAVSKHTPRLPPETLDELVYRHE